MFNFEEGKQKEILQRLKFDNKTIKNVCGIRKLTYEIRKYSKDELVPQIIVKRILNYNDIIVDDVITALKCTSYLDCIDTYYVFLNYMIECLSECKNECYKISHLKVNGEDMKSIGIFGKEIGITLNLLLFAVLEGRVTNDYNTLIAYIRKLKLNQKNY